MVASSAIGDSEREGINRDLIEVNRLSSMAAVASLQLGAEVALRKLRQQLHAKVRRVVEQLELNAKGRLQHADTDTDRHRQTQTDTDTDTDTDSARFVASVARRASGRRHQRWPLWWS